MNPAFVVKAATGNPTASKTHAGRRDFALCLSGATLSGVLWFLACPGFDLWPLAWVAMVPALFAIERAPSRRRAVFLAWWMALVGNAGGFYWCVEVLKRFGELSWAAAAFFFLLLCAYQGLRLAIFGWVYYTVRRRAGLPAALVAPVVMVTVEMCVPFVFPYYLAITQATQIHVIQVADIAGPLGVTALLLMVNGAAYDLVTRGRRGWAAAAAAAAVMAVALGYGHWRIGQFEGRRREAPKLTVGVVQPNIAFDQKGIQGASPDYLRALQEQSARLEAAGAELLIWPETIYPSYIPRFALGDWREGHQLRIRRGFDAPLIFGALSGGGSHRQMYNSAFMLDRAGVFTGRYDKNSLLMFGEYVPGVETFPVLRELVPGAAEALTPGEGVVAFSYQSAAAGLWRVAPMICLEDTLPSLGRQMATLRPHLIVNLTDDSWFGDTSEPWQHLALSVFRSVELRTEMIRAVNPGVSAHVDATGRILLKTYSLDPASSPRGADGMLAEVSRMEGGHTPYAAVGDLFGYLNVAFTLYIWLILARRRGGVSKTASRIWSAP